MDANGDGRADLVVLTPGAGGTITAWTMLGRADGSFGSPSSGTTPISNENLEKIDEEPDAPGVLPTTELAPEDFLAGDWNGDGAGDIGAVRLSFFGATIARAHPDWRGTGWTREQPARTGVPGCAPTRLRSR